MKILVFSDSHGNYSRAFQAHRDAGPVDAIVHLGDGAEDARLVEEVLEVPVLAVAGNCDYASNVPSERLLRFGEDTVFATHGNRYQVKSGLALLERRALEVGATIVLYGHTHRAAAESRGGIFFLNPGKLMGEGASYAILTLGESLPRAEIVPLR